MVATIVLLAACSGSDEVAEDDPFEDGGPLIRGGAVPPRVARLLLPAGGWRVYGAAVDDVRLSDVDGFRLVIRIDEEGWGFAGCVWPEFIQDGRTPDGRRVGDALAFECGPYEAEGSLADGLRRGEEVDTTSDGFVLRGEGVVVRVAEFAPVNEAVFDREWTLVEWVPTLQHDLVPAVAPSRLLLHADGRFEGTSGCDEEISGVWERQDDGLRMPIFDITAPCSNADPELVDQHGWVTMMGIGIRPVLTEDGQMHIVMGVGDNDRVSLVYERPSPGAVAHSAQSGVSMSFVLASWRTRSRRKVGTCARPAATTASASKVSPSTPPPAAIIRIPKRKNAEALAAPIIRPSRWGSVSVNVMRIHGWCSALTLNRLR